VIAAPRGPARPASSDPVAADARASHELAAESAAAPGSAGAQESAAPAGGVPASAPSAASAIAAGDAGAARSGAAGAGASGAAAAREAIRSFRLGVWNGALYQAGDGFIDAGTVIPVLVSRLTASGALIGFAASLSDMGWLLPQFLITPYSMRQPRQLTLYRQWAVVRGLALALLAALAIPLQSHPHALLAALLALYGLYCVGAGIGGVSFMDVVGRTVPLERLGTFWASRLFWGGSLAALAGVVVRWVMRVETSAAQYVILFGFAAILTSAGYALFASIHEPPASAGEPPASPLHHLAEGFRWWRENPEFRHLLLARGTVGCWLTVAPFAVLFALRDLMGGAAAAGTFLMSRIAGYVLANLAWGPLSRRYGSRAPLVVGVVGIGAVSLATALVAYLSPWSLGLLPRSTAVLVLEALVFFGGAAHSGVLVGFGSLLLELAPQGRRIEFVSLTNTFLAPCMLIPVIGGALVDRIHAPAVFALCGLLGLLGLRAALRLPSPTLPVPASLPRASGGGRS
jgi:hypothetical protein